MKATVVSCVKNSHVLNPHSIESIHVLAVSSKSTRGHAVSLFSSQPPRELTVTAAGWAKAQSGEVERPGNSPGSPRAWRWRHSRALGLNLPLYFMVMALRKFSNLSGHQFIHLKTVDTKLA